MKVSMDMPYGELRDTVRDGIENYFKTDLGRPEILNRIGENIVVYDFIRKDSDIPRQILGLRLTKIEDGLAENKNIVLEVSNEAKNQLLEKAKDNLENGGRGIGNIVESMFVNPLSRFIFDHRDQLLTDPGTVKKLEVIRIKEEEYAYSVECSIS